MLIAILVVLSLLVLYVAWLTEKTRTNTSAIATSLTQKKSGTDAYAVDQPRLGYEWHEDGWPQLSSDDENNREPWVPFVNPRPFEFIDAYSESLLVAEFNASPAGLERKTFLKRFYRESGAYLPIPLADAAAKDADPAVRIWIAAHMNLIYEDYSTISENILEAWEHAPIIRNYAEILGADPEPIVRAALWSNPDHPKLPFPIPMSGATHAWEQSIAAMFKLDRLALMRNDNIDSDFIVALMKADARCPIQARLWLEWDAKIQVPQVSVTAPRRGDRPGTGSATLTASSIPAVPPIAAATPPVSSRF